MQGARGSMMREVGLALVALALALRILVAPGFMPVIGVGGVTVSMCTGQGVVEVAVPGKAPLQKAHDPCPYAALGQPPLVPPLDLLPAAMPLLAAIAPALAPLAQRPHVGAPAPPPPSTGPPATA